MSGGANAHFWRVAGNTPLDGNPAGNIAAAAAQRERFLEEKTRFSGKPHLPGKTLAGAPCRFQEILTENRSWHETGNMGHHGLYPLYTLCVAGNPIPGFVYRRSASFHRHLKLDEAVAIREGPSSHDSSAGSGRHILYKGACCPHSLMSSLLNFSTEAQISHEDFSNAAQDDRINRRGRRQRHDPQQPRPRRQRYCLPRDPEMAVEHDEGHLRCIRVGDPLSGKISVVQAITGFDFARSDRMRVVIEISMTKGLPGSTLAACIFTTENRCDAKELSSPDDVTSVVEQKTKDLARGQYKKFAADLVIVEVTSPAIPNLSIVDVPGFDEIEEVVEINKSSKSTPSSRCPTSLFSLGPPRRPHTDDHRLLTRKSFSLGCVMILGRSQKHMEEGVGIEGAKDRETAFLKEHPELRTVTDHLVGPADLVAILSRVAQLRKREVLRKPKADFHEAMSSALAKLATLGPDPGQTAEEKRALLAEVWGVISQVLSEGTTGRFSHPVFKKSDLLLRARANALSDDFEATREQVPRLAASGFVNSALFDSRVARYIELWTAGAANLSESVRVLVVAVARTVLQEFASHVPHFIDEVLPLLDDVARRLAEEAIQRIIGSFESERRPFSRKNRFADAVEHINRAKASRGAEPLGPDYATLLSPKIKAAFENAKTKLSPKIKATLEDNKTTERTVEAIFNQLRSAPETPFGPTSARAEAEDLASRLEAYWPIASSRLDLKVQALLSDVTSVLAISKETLAFQKRREDVQNHIKGLAAVKDELGALEHVAAFRIVCGLRMVNAYFVHEGKGGDNFEEAVRVFAPDYGEVENDLAGSLV
ncbi:hypothetical protein BDK51DRAFT_40653 [Blyttiomyces helicus]|uniref:Uncharacterized protein n=1 Tax=Blyttiomyces helicus TaxID=388810 RepID=A0A4P9WHB3_9FUNG|nr:hypothetical protein BDK51DRAFT_40653 [Blyttiomyces helicus]|eukprot:RKO89916.1 hypothetical protein BDK51DRAFT_40653 [Blyttiomyces helicus]